MNNGIHKLVGFFYFINEKKLISNLLQLIKSQFNYKVHVYVVNLKKIFVYIFLHIVVCSKSMQWIVPKVYSDK